MDTIVNGFSQLAASLGLLITTLLGHPQTTANTTISAKQTVSMQQTANGPTYNLSKSLSYMGHSVTLSATIPKNGGNITGSVSGDCTGTITGQYDGKDNGTINGQGNANCQVSFVQIPGTVTFTGTVNKTAKNAHLLVSLHVGSINTSQNIVVNLN